jgi:hypothetical protein
VDASSILALRANRRRVFILVAFQGLLLQRARRAWTRLQFWRFAQTAKDFRSPQIPRLLKQRARRVSRPYPFSCCFATNRLKCPFSILSHPDGLMLRVARRARRSHHVVASVTVFQDWQEHWHEDRQEAWREAWREPWREAWREAWRERVQQMLVPLTIWRAAIRLAGASERSAFYKYLCGGRAYAT